MSANGTPVPDDVCFLSDSINYCIVLMCVKGAITPSCFGLCLDEFHDLLHCVPDIRVPITSSVIHTGIHMVLVVRALNCINHNAYSCINRIKPNYKYSNKTVHYSTIQSVSICKYMNLYYSYIHQDDDDADRKSGSSRKTGATPPSDHHYHMRASSLHHIEKKTPPNKQW